MGVSELLWSPAPAGISLGEREIHVWRVDLDQPEQILLSARQLLSADEQERADRFFFDVDRRRFVVARAALRTVLGGYLKIEPPEVRFTYGLRGKPFLGEEHSGGIAFNLSHSGSVALIAAGRCGWLGVDVEQVRPIGAGEIVDSCFSLGERREFWAVPPHQRQAAFFNCWTRKEAFAKAIGDGLAVALDQVEVSMAPGEAATLRRVAGNGSKAREWSIWDVSPRPGAIGALAAHGHGWRVSCWVPGDDICGGAILL